MCNYTANMYIKTHLLVPLSFLFVFVLLSPCPKVLDHIHHTDRFRGQSYS